MAHNKINSSNSVISILEEVSARSGMPDHDQGRHEGESSHHHHRAQHSANYIPRIVPIFTKFPFT